MTTADKATVTLFLTLVYIVGGWMTYRWMRAEPVAPGAARWARTFDTIAGVVWPPFWLYSLGRGFLRSLAGLGR